MSIWELFSLNLSFFAGYTWTRDVIMGMGSIGDNFGIDRNHEDSHLCGTSSCDIYKHLRQAEVIYNVDNSLSYFVLKW